MVNFITTTVRTSNPKILVLVLAFGMCSSAKNLFYWKLGLKTGIAHPLVKPLVRVQACPLPMIVAIVSVPKLED
jgi:hypothetical protein